MRGFPTIKIFGANKRKPEDFNGARTAKGIVDAALDAIRKKIESQGGSSSGGSSSSGGGSKDNKVPLQLVILFCLYYSIYFILTGLINQCYPLCRMSLSSLIQTLRKKC